MRMKPENMVQIRVQVLMSNNIKLYGDLSIAEGYRSRVSDLLNDDRRFLPLTKVEWYVGKEKKKKTTNFLCLNKEAIILLAEYDPNQPESSAGL